MEYLIKTNPTLSVCGLNCGLCPNYHINTTGKFKCPGCAGEGFSGAHPTCAILSCCQSKGVEYCWLCSDYPCYRYENADASDSFITHKNQLKDIDKARQIGIDAYVGEQSEKISILQNLLANYNDGRKKSFFCVVVNLLELQDVKRVIRQIENEVDPSDPIKEKARTATRLFQALADERFITLKLRKK
ncbi:MAG: DUF3795 domain-containing protein [Eubacteriaceae bacterium]|nr:DUF3795 domain-containing protein [Eubacteriaceae bacterium]